ncbi:MAG: segregation/condensation protein A [Candidatus Aenigmatarchaeota archaeon]
MVSEPSWEDVIVKIIAEEGMDPWSVDIIRLSDVFLDYLKKVEGLDLRIPARFILIASILLRMKSDVLAEKKDKVLIPESEKEPDDMLRILAEVPPLNPPLKRIPLRNVSLDELISALRKAYDVQDRRVERKRRVKRAVDFAMPVTEEDITLRIEKLLTNINQALVEVDNIEFSRLVKRWGRKEIVETLIPLLHLSQDGKINLLQNEMFKEITVRMKKDQT